MKTSVRNFGLAAIAAMALTSAANALVLSLGIANPAIFPPYPGPYGSVTVSLVDATHATLAYSSVTPQYYFGDGGSVAFNTNSTVTVAIGAPTFPQNVPTLTPGGAGNEDGFGSFSYTVNNTGGWTERFSAVTLSLTNTGGTWANEAAILNANASGYLVAAHIFVSNADGTAAAVTGFAVNGNTPTNTPSVADGGTSVILLGLALGALALFPRKCFV